MIYTSFDNVGLYKVLSFLKSHNTEYLSGQDLSDVLKISRVAIWKHIKKIKTLGYKIETKQKLGYRLVETTPLLLPWEITDGLNTKSIGKRIYFFDVTDSTQNFALGIANNRRENGTVVIAQRQTKGKGRLGRRWLSPSGGIWFSVIFHPEFNIEKTTLFPIASSVALHKAIQKTLGVTTELKWPNDITLKGKKIAGMIVDASLESNKIENLVLGVGINYNIDIVKARKILKETAHFYGIDSLRTNVKPVKLVQAFLYELEAVNKLLNQGKTKKIIKYWTENSSTLGKKITIQMVSGKTHGTAKRLEEDGALLLVRNKDQERILAGDVTHVL